MNIGIACLSPALMERLQHIIMRAPNHRIAWLASDDVELEYAWSGLQADIVLVCGSFVADSGVRVVEDIVRYRRKPVLMVSNHPRYLADVFAGISAGAVDMLELDEQPQDMQAESTELMRKISLADTLSRHKNQFQTPVVETLSGHQARYLVAIGSSAGGPEALLKLLGRFQGQLSAAFLVAQHMDAALIPQFSEWISQHVELKVKIAEEGEQIRAGTVYFSKGNSHLVLKPKGILGYTLDTQNHAYCPSIDMLFDSVVDNAVIPACGLLLSGMGEDGAQGLLNMRTHGFYTIAQSEWSASVNGMPRAAAQAKAADDMLSPERMADAIRLRYERQDNKPYRGAGDGL